MFVGHTRFSLYIPGTGAWRASDGSTFDATEEYKKHLYDPERLRTRAEIFFDLTLPLLANAARGHPVLHFVSYSESLPQTYQHLLERAAREYSFLRLNGCVDGAAPEEPVELLRREQGNQDLVFAEYRLDDDDILSVDFFEQLKPYVNISEVGRFVSLSYGVTAVYSDGVFYDVRRCRQPMVAIGLSRICRIYENGNIEQPPTARHTVSDTAAPVILDSRQMAYMWTRHASQDTAVAYQISLKPDEVRAHLGKLNSKFPPVSDWTEVETHFPRLAERMSSGQLSGNIETLAVEKRMRINGKGLSFDLPSLVGPIDFTVHVRSGSPKGSREAEMVLHLEDTSGNSVTPMRLTSPPSGSARAVRWGGRDSTRWAAQLRTSAGLAGTTGTLHLSVGVRLTGVTVRPVGDGLRTGYLEHLSFISPSGE